MFQANPFPHLVLDGFFPGDILAAANDAWPDDTWPGWVQYSGERGQKRASDLLTPLPAACGELLRRMTLMGVADVLDHAQAIPDLSLWGAGLHEMGPGGSLPLHLDADRHARLGLERVLSTTLYVHPRWDEGWGGEFELYASRDGYVQQAIQPAPGRFVAFDARGDHYHAVAPVACPTGHARRSLALFWYGPAPRTPGVRPRAEFVSG